MLKLCRVTKVNVLFLVLVYVFNFNCFEFSAFILEKGLFTVQSELFKLIEEFDNQINNAVTERAVRYTCNVQLKKI